MRVSFPRWWLLGLALLPQGCGNQEQRLPVHPVRGQVFYEGKPLPLALVVLHPVQPPQQEVPRPRAQVSREGSFVVGTYETADGAPAGEYRVTVECWRSRGGDSAPANVLPARYARADTSNLRVSVREGENQIPVIRLSH